MKNFINAIIGGIFIAFGAGVYLKTGCTPIGAILFAAGLLTICLCQYKLYTGVIGYVNSFDTFKTSMLILLGNFIGSFAILGIGGISEIAQELVTTKLAVSPFLLFLRACFCGMIIYCCVDIFKKDNKNGILYIPFGIAVFILIGAEHSIADMCYFIAANSFNLYTLLMLLIIICGNSFGSLLLDKIKKI